MNKKKIFEKSNHRIYIHLLIAIFSIALVKEVIKIPPFNSATLDDYSKIATIIQAIAAVGIAFQIWLSHKEIKADHERSRREKSVELLMQWSQNLKKEGSLARKILECLSEEQCRELYKQEKVKISIKHKSLVEQFLNDPNQKFEDETSDTFTITQKQAASLRWHAVTYLNSLEFTFVAWQYSIADREIIEGQFKYLFNQENGSGEFLKHFRKAAGGATSFPATEVFAAHIIQKSKDHLRQKANVA